MKDKKEKYGNWEREFLEFANSDPVNPPPVLTEKIKNIVSQNLKPAIWKIFSKLAAIQAVCATRSLIVGIPNGRLLPSSLSIQTRFTGLGR